VRRSVTSTDPSGTWAVRFPWGAQMRAAGRLAGDFSRSASQQVGVPGPTGPQEGPDQSALADVPWTLLHQVHGARVVMVDRPGGGYGEEADGAVSSCSGAALAVVTADCAPVGLCSPEGVIGIVHAGWRGLMAGVVEAAVAAMRGGGASDVLGALGPCIFPHAYRFSSTDLEAVVARFGPRVRAVDAEGYPALDLPAAVGAALERSDATLVADARTCTHCSPAHWSWRARADEGRQATVIWRPAGTNPADVGPQMRLCGSRPG